MQAANAAAVRWTRLCLLVMAIVATTSACCALSFPSCHEVRALRDGWYVFRTRSVGECGVAEAQTPLGLPVRGPYPTRDAAMRAMCALYESGSGDPEKCSRITAADKEWCSAYPSPHPSDERR